ncbi:hypothetical protein LTR10_021850 [Elasticomyces elasticus]|uniref:C2 domain-containing protein n=1 Tax=Exophiala sideris TaxID=1016849 RepID=A0ABR0JF52_9EURO|nr:hypothetical protein LTR10_021850 [Elasticomyces elasticus]KAK5025282.1 hypothetical protein LTS07_008133 [Exophiala sideris]KAK5029169.1 hypothetical protein LTR13_008706 [Exophiala sideris]KAK5063342.1 hypothetical protein LTR69_004048 [Exophiala sideris]KAK5179057.1 hypothetical protein LTR44_008546 [Eurotiomycetes sp. CCFEE 6388]
MATKSRALNAAHTAGIFADMTLDGPEIGTLVAVVDRAKNLPNRKTMGKQDPYCAMRLGKEAKKTGTDRRGGQTPKWDQELRFIVHDSPDYYKLKCSIFNDDKKTDMIGEAWIDLREVIVPGGGQNDLWHQLNFKGKYAGDVRVELTYYDTRPRPDVSERMRQREKSRSSTGDGTSNSLGSRQLGPREIKRRPLPPGPGGYSAPVSASYTPERIPSEESRDFWNDQIQIPPRPPKQRMPETPDDVGYGLPIQNLPDPYDLSPEPELSHEQRRPSYDYYNQPGRQSSPQDSFLYNNPDPYEQRPLPPTQTQSSPAYLPQAKSVNEAQHIPSPHSPHDAIDQTLYQSSPPSRTTPQATPPRPAQTQTWQGRTSTSPTKHAVYRDSPLRHSISQHDMLPPEQSIPDARFDEDVPPPPPAHRASIPRVPMVSASPHHSPYGQVAPRTPVKYGSVEERSPLQRLEREYDLSHLTFPPSQNLQHQSPSTQFLQGSLNKSSPSDFAQSGGQALYTAYSENMTQSRPVSARYTRQSFGHAQGGAETAQQSYGDFREDFGRSPGYGPPRRAQTFDDYGSSERQAHSSDPVIVRPRAISPTPSHTIPRKSVTPTTPVTPDSQRRLSEIPYSPDSYDMLNTGTSPIGELGSYVTPEAAKEAARQREVDKLREQGPIIGNDGRVIDPSDHLPANTWAPEPERKNRKPEHVIKIRTREEVRMQHGGGSFPVPARPHSMPTSPYHATSNAPVSSPYQASPSASALPLSPQADPGSGRNRLRKPMPTRPLPVQPYPHAQTSPAIVTLPQEEIRPSPSSQQRYTIGSSPASGPPNRPPLAEYQSPAVDDYNPYRQNYPTTPTKPAVQTSGYPDHGYGVENSLALELSTIDIGPSRTGRTSLRPARGYPAY